MSDSDRPRYRVDADRQAAQRRVRYVETNRPDDGSCTICQLDEDNPAPLDETPAMAQENPSNDEDEAFAESTLIQAIENQLEAGEPAATQATLNKLTLVGYERDECLQMMALVLAHEIRTMLSEDRPFDGAAYEAMLRKLPELPDASE
ncbi:Uncharacterised protein [Stutzerimonas stutzeri]|uniref:hypothetical protein n=1 Tax=Stutzerimonas stutzeri subgroup TaxID=578833 RepID=UPI000C6D3928|nr:MULTISPECIES: hypothetical protein [Stutzerimonas stutzeri subgroup]MCQ2046509.1 hypothetical protein [Stutzerimonas kunmingensis]PKR26127.1 hypothetical protein CXK90_16675 [Stutzerimonas stutzeri]QQC12161.1 hypothetical protein I6I22_04935 [Stutzerimonas stutzeri]VEI37205.1 Uncharacterised protein [Stutzerimonas stutzeri]